MERVINTLRGRLIGVVLLVLAALVPLLYLGVSAIVWDGYTELFVNPVRAYSKLVADELEASDSADFERHASELLDSVLLSGQVVYAEVFDGPRRIHGSLPSARAPGDRRDDFYFGSQGDEVYYISHTVKRPGRNIVLRLGFDESPTLERIRAARQRVLIAMLAFTVASLAVAIWLSSVIARPMVRLQEAAKRVAGGDVGVRLQTWSGIREVRELNHHLERMRQELVGTNERLGREIQEREALEQQRLELERRLLHRERIATIGTLAGGIAHEFNNIMTPILLYSQVALQDAEPDGPLARDLRRIIAAAHRARNLVTGILTFSREMDSRAAGAFPLRPTLDEAVALLRAIVPANVEITLRSQDEEVFVFGEPSLIHQVVINLCTNSYQAMRRSGGTLVLDMRLVTDPADRQVPAGHYVRLEVSDTGHGMDAAVLAHIFDPFFTTREVGEGTGLGLSVVHGIVTSMRGTITVESAVDRGTIVRVYLPVAEAAAPSRQVSASNVT